jgi:hypothetical protein
MLRFFLERLELAGRESRVSAELKRRDVRYWHLADMAKLRPNVRF